MSANNNKVNQIVENIALSNIETIEEVLKEIQLLQSRIITTEKQMILLTDIQKQIVRLRTVELQSWRSIASKVNYNHVSCIKYYKNAGEVLSSI